MGRDTGRRLVKYIHSFMNATCLVFDGGWHKGPSQGCGCSGVWEGIAHFAIMYRVETAVRDMRVIDTFSNDHVGHVVST
jgi:hypothetical protein